MVECNLAKVDVAGSNPVSRSGWGLRLMVILSEGSFVGYFLITRFGVLENASRFFQLSMYSIARPGSVIPSTFSSLCLAFSVKLKLPVITIFWWLYIY